MTLSFVFLRLDFRENGWKVASVLPCMARTLFRQIFPGTFCEGYAVVVVPHMGADGNFGKRVWAGEGRLVA